MAIEHLADIGNCASQILNVPTLEAYTFKLVPFVCSTGAVNARSGESTDPTDARKDLRDLIMIFAREVAEFVFFVRHTRILLGVDVDTTAIFGDFGGVLSTDNEENYLDGNLRAFVVAWR